MHCMNRRSFLAMSSLGAAIPVVATAEEQIDNPEEMDWYETIYSDALEFTAKAEVENEEADIRLHVQLVRPADEEFIEIKNEQGKFVAYEYRGKVAPEYFYPGRTLLTRFDLTWDGKAIPIPERFWNDIGGLMIQTTTVDPSKFKEEKHWEALDFIKGLMRPRLTLSADGGTVLIEWRRPEDCDSRSTYRWIVSKSGTVLRHRDCPPHYC
jgi:hypothetical protein